VCRISLRMRSFHHGWVHTQFFHETHNLNQPDFLKHHYMTSIASARNFNNGGIIRCNWKCTFKVLARFFRLDLNLWKLNKLTFLGSKRHSEDRFSDHSDSFGSGTNYVFSSFFVPAPAQQFLHCPRNVRHFLRKWRRIAECCQCLRECNVQRVYSRPLIALKHSSSPAK